MVVDVEVVVFVVVDVEVVFVVVMLKTQNGPEYSRLNTNYVHNILLLIQLKDQENSSKNKNFLHVFFYLNFLFSQFYKQSYH